MKLKILVVDDERFILSLIKRTLVSMGYIDVETVETGYEAIERLSNGRKYDIVICDLCMPRLDGMEFIRVVNDARYIGGLIVLSGQDERILSSAVNLARKYKLNILGALGKPIERSKLENMIAGYEQKSRKATSASSCEISQQELQDGITAGESGPLEMFYQPKINIRSGAITGVEALARWQHPTRGLLPPYAFVSLAEELELIDSLTKVVFKKAVRQTMKWHQQGHPMVTSINFSVNSFSDPTLANFIFDVLNEFDVSPKYINIEVTETQAMNNETECIENLIRLRLNNFGLSIDDFGTGNSSLAQLKRIPFTELKIDREFVNCASGSKEAIAMLESTVNLAKKLGMQVVAEGAETKEDWDLVARLGCDFVQGYYCGRPMPTHEFEHFLTEWNSHNQIASSSDNLKIFV